MAPEKTAAAAVAATDGGQEVIIFYTLEPEQEEGEEGTRFICQFCDKEFKTAAKKKYHISKYHVLLR
jgi:hypothetical protein